MTGFRIDPWCRIHEDDVEAGTPATVFRGARYGALTAMEHGDVSAGEAIMVWPATVTAVARGDDGAIEQMLVRNEQTNEVRYYTREHYPLVRAGYDRRRGGWFGAAEGWLVVVGERAIAEKCTRCKRKRVDIVAMETTDGATHTVCFACACPCNRGPACTCQPCGCADDSHASCGLGDR